MNCYICDSDNWERTDLHKDGGNIQICKNCGNVCHAVDPSKESEIIEYYRHKYRPAPSISNIITSTHKKFYVEMFLNDFLKDKKGLICGDIGSAIGYIPAMLRQRGHKAFGCELTVTYRRFSEHFYGIPQTEELNEKFKYDLITIYHVLEHLMEPDKKLKKYVDLLKDDGRIMIACPEWFNELEESSGSPISNFEHLFHKDHINIFSETSIKNLFRKCGLMIEKEDHITYGQTYLLRKMTKPEREHYMATLGSMEDGYVQVPPEDKNILIWTQNEDWQVQLEAMKKMKQAIELYFQGMKDAQVKREGGAKFLDALEAWPKFPEAWMALIMNTNLKDPIQQEDLFKKAFAVLPTNTRLHLCRAIWLYQRQQFQDALQEFDWLMKNRPSEDISMYIGWCHENIGNYREAIQSFNNSANQNPQKWAEAYSHICWCVNKLPSWDEMAKQQIQEQLMKQAQYKIEPNDKMAEDIIKELESPK